MIKTLLLSLVFVSGASAAFAQDTLNWSGPYIGGSLDLSSAETNIVGNRFTYNQSTSVNAVDHLYNGAGLSGFAGYNLRRNDLVFGGELALGRSDLSSDLRFNSDDDIDQVSIGWSGNLVARIGLVRDETLLYAKGGVAFADIYNLGGDNGVSGLSLTDAHMRDEVRWGPTVGFGIENFLSDSLIARIEYSYTDYDAYAQANQDGAPGSQVYQVNNGPVQTLSLGLAFQF